MPIFKTRNKNRFIIIISLFILLSLTSCADENSTTESDGQGGIISTPAIPIPETPGFHYVDIASSTDGANLESSIYLPERFSPDDGPYPVVMFINGGQGLKGINIIPWLKAEADKRDWIVITSSGRQWDLFDKNGCSYTTAMAYLNHPDPDIGPDETDRLDVIQWVKDNYKVNEDKVYLSGFSLGGRGAYQIGLRNPDIFAGIALFAPAVDLFELDIYTDTSRDSYPCRIAIAGGTPGTSLLTRTRRLMSSARFLIENAYNLPIFHGHGYYDGLANNVVDDPVRKYLYGYHMTINNSFNGVYEYDGEVFDFGHTPTLSELHAEHPDGYNFAYMFSDSAHLIDNRWITGTPVAPEVEGIQHPDDSTMYIGAIDFLASKTRVLNPDTVFYKSYTDEHRRSHWVEIDIESPWQATPGAVKATSFANRNTVNMQLSHIDTVTIDIDRIGLTIGTSATEPLTIHLSPMNSNTYDPALKVTSVTPKIVLSGNFSELTPAGVELKVNDQILGPNQVSIADTKIVIDKILVQSVTEILVYLKK